MFCCSFLSKVMPSAIVLLVDSLKVYLLLTSYPRSFLFHVFPPKRLAGQTTLVVVLKLLTCILKITAVIGHIQNPPYWAEAGDDVALGNCCTVSLKDALTRICSRWRTGSCYTKVTKTAEQTKDYHCYMKPKMVELELIAEIERERDGTSWHSTLKSQPTRKRNSVCLFLQTWPPERKPKNIYHTEMLLSYDLFHIARWFRLIWSLKLSGFIFGHQNWARTWVKKPDWWLFIVFDEIGFACLE